MGLFHDELGYRAVLVCVLSHFIPNIIFTFGVPCETNLFLFSTHTDFCSFLHLHHFQLSKRNFIVKKKLLSNFAISAWKILLYSKQNNETSPDSSKNFLQKETFTYFLRASIPVTHLNNAVNKLDSPYIHTISLFLAQGNFPEQIAFI